MGPDMADISGVNLSGVRTGLAQGPLIGPGPENIASGRVAPDRAATDHSPVGKSQIGPPLAPLLPRPDTDILAGPSPAFQASLLEIQSDLQNVINRMAAARELARNEQAISPVKSLTNPPDKPTIALPVQDIQQPAAARQLDLAQHKIGMTK